MGDHSCGDATFSRVGSQQRVVAHATLLPRPSTTSREIDSASLAHAQRSAAAATTAAVAVVVVAAEEEERADAVSTVTVTAEVEAWSILRAAM